MGQKSLQGLQNQKQLLLNLATGHFDPQEDCLWA
jgi:hypothetical protein